jgi:hypothetical protein
MESRGGKQTCINFDDTAKKNAVRLDKRRSKKFVKRWRK